MGEGGGGAWALSPTHPHPPLRMGPGAEGLSFGGAVSFLPSSGACRPVAEGEVRSRVRACPLTVRQPSWGPKLTDRGPKAGGRAPFIRRPRPRPGPSAQRPGMWRRAGVPRRGRASPLGSVPLLSLQTGAPSSDNPTSSAAPPPPPAGSSLRERAGNGGARLCWDPEGARRGSGHRPPGPAGPRAPRAAGERTQAAGGLRSSGPGERPVRLRQPLCGHRGLGGGPGPAHPAVPGLEDGGQTEPPHPFLPFAMERFR